VIIFQRHSVHLA